MQKMQQCKSIQRYKIKNKIGRQLLVQKCKIEKNAKGQKILKIVKIKKKQKNTT